MVDPLRPDDAAEPAPLGLGALLVSVVFAFGVSAVAGVLTGLIHAQLPPWGLLACIGVSGALIIGFRLVFESRAACAAAAAGILVGSLLLVLPGAGPSPIRLDGGAAWSTWVWLLWPVVVEAATLVAPALNRGRARP